MFYQDALRAFDALIGEVDGAGPEQKQTAWMKQAWHRRLTWMRWLHELRRYCEDRETMALAHHIQTEQLITALRMTRTRDEHRQNCRVEYCAKCAELQSDTVRLRCEALGDEFNPESVPSSASGVES